VIGTARYDRMRFETKTSRPFDPGSGSPDDFDVDERISSWTGGLGGVYRASEEVHLVGSWNRGFRQNAPAFGVVQLAEGVQVPSDFLDPTESDTFEAGVKAKGRGFRVDAFVWRSQISNYQGELQPTSYGGSSFLDLNENGTKDPGEQYVERTEGGDAWVQGIEVQATVRPNAFLPQVPPHWTVRGGFATNYGRSDADGHDQYVENTQPTRGILAVRWDDLDHPSRNLWVELSADMVARYDRIPDSLQGDIAYLQDPADPTSGLLRSYVGTPGYTIFALHAGIDVAENATLHVGVENLFDKRYRPAHSRMDGPGIGVTASLEIRF
jgi:outer membrane receptor protein involved in Fe transport